MAFFFLLLSKLLIFSYLLCRCEPYRSCHILTALTHQGYSTLVHLLLLDLRQRRLGISRFSVCLYMVDHWFPQKSPTNCLQFLSKAKMREIVQEPEEKHEKEEHRWEDSGGLQRFFMLYMLHVKPGFRKLVDVGRVREQMRIGKARSTFFLMLINSCSLLCDVYQSGMTWGQAHLK